jgi:uncharacterized protein YjbJ (UPF0337 family)
MGEIDGKVDEAKGRVKQAAGALTDDPDLEAEGRVDRATGAAKDTVGKVKDKVDDAIDTVRDKLKNR